MLTNVFPTPSTRKSRPDPFYFRWGFTGVALCIISGFLLAATFPPFNQTWLAWFALVPLLLALRWSEDVRDWPHFSGWLTGMVFFTSTLWWIGNVTIPGMLVLMVYLSLYPAAWAFCVRHCALQGPAWESQWAILKNAAGAACVWVTLEWLRGWLLTGFGWNNIGLAGRGNWLVMQLAALGGVNLIAWLIVFVNCLIAQGIEQLRAVLFREEKLRFFYEFSFALLTVVLAFVGGHFTVQYYSPKGEGRPLIFACLQGNVPRDNGTGETVMPAIKPGEPVTTPQPLNLSETDIYQRYMGMAAEAGTYGPDIIIWPECTSNMDLSLAAAAITARSRAWQIVGTMVMRPKLHNAAMWLNPHDTSFQLYYKANLVPFGEFVPFGDWLPALRDFIPINTDFVAGTGPALFELVRPNRAGNGIEKIRLTPLICFEDTLPEFVNKAARLNPDLLVNITNDNWFDGTPGSEMHLVNSIFRTVENNMPMIRCANSGISAFIDRKGKVVFPADSKGRLAAPLTQGVFGGTAHLHPPQITLYRRFGEWIVLISAVVAFMLMFHARLYPYKQ
ncbi:apolipoprotein N-acyltransferase [Verrucomicrobia bacterium LW23]|nr:apolipoprotein N-acyltransferase [Verrucomicrobia bacterium LW23]